MLIHQPTKKIVLNLKNPGRVTTVIPSAKTFLYKGRELVAVPHRLDETKVLRNLGFADTPSPIELYYPWSGQYTPFKAQEKTASFLTMNPRAFVLSDIGTGKTLGTLWAYDYLRSIGRARKALIASPLSTLERTWGDEIFRHFPHLTFSVLHGSPGRRKALLDADADIYLINHDGLKIMEPSLRDRPDIDVVVLDEIAVFRNASTIRWKAAAAVIAGRAWVWGLTGTPTPNLPTDAWAQCRLISPSRVPRYFGRFKESVLHQISPFRWVARDAATQVVADAMQPAIRFSREECVDLPPVMTVERHAEMSPPQKVAYQQMLSTLAAEIGDKQILAANAAVMLSKLIQIACGCAYGPDGEAIAVPAKERIAVVLEVIEQAKGKVIVFVPFTAVLTYVAEEIRAAGYSVETVCGQTSKSQRDSVFGNFQGEAHPRVLVAQPAAMSHGLTLTSANTIIWYAPITSNDIRQQANGRITRPGQTRKQFIVNISGTPVERKIYARLDDKQTLQGVLLDTIKSC